MRADAIGLYVHIPFCVRKCNYCDFASTDKHTENLRRDYIDALIREIKSYNRESPIAVDTVFFGGGTPSVLSPEEFRKISSAIRETFDLSDVKEITVEANPKTLTAEKCEAYRTAGVNRISIGLQSIHENEQKSLGRIHNLDDFLLSFELVRTYFDNLSVDLMYGIPHQTKESFAETLAAVSALPVKHISVYGLIVEEGTPFGRMRDTLPLPTEDEEADMYRLAKNMLSRSGFSHYEISNYAREGYECQHNLKYWRAEEYVGVGVAAASYFDKKRYVNSSDISEYLAADFTNYNRRYEIPDEKFEYAMLRLRLREGISLPDYEARFSESFLSDREELIREYTARGLVECRDGRLFFTDEGFYISNYLLIELL